MTELKDKNHVVRSSGMFGTWGRGETLEEALSNADLSKTDQFTHFHFKNDNWDILDTGAVTWNDGDLITQEEHNALPL